MKNTDIIALGEGLIELSSNQSLTYADTLDKYYGGDSLTTAISALRQGAGVGYISKVGRDAFCEFLLDSWQTEGLDISHVKTIEGHNGLYFIATCGSGKKELAYYRRRTAATTLSEDDIDEDYIKKSKIVYATGITQSLSLSAKEAVLKMFKIAKENGIKTAYDLNFDPMIWTKEEAKEALEEIEDYVDIMFANIKTDFIRLIDIDSPNKLIKMFWDKGISIVVLKSQTEKGYYIGYNGEITFSPFYTDTKIDSTGAGDAFNGAFLVEILNGKTPFKAVDKASIVAGLQVKNIGAIKSIPYSKEVDEVMESLSQNSIEVKAEND